MDKVLVAGIETVVGGNLAATLTSRCSVTGVSLGEAVSLDGCATEARPAPNAEAVRQLVEKVRPAHIVFCGSASRSSWDPQSRPTERDVTQAAWWAEAAQKVGAKLTLISSDAVFTGPWMFHSENSQSFCPSDEAKTVRAIEARVAEICPEALIIRTHAFGWQPGATAGWLENLLVQLERSFSSTLDGKRYASPILATDLANIIVAAWTNSLSGIHHVAGSERVNPVQFASRLASQFHLPIPLTLASESFTERPTGYGCGETSLQTRRIRRLVGISMPMLDESLQRLFQQHVDGYRSRLAGSGSVRASKVA